MLARPKVDPILEAIVPGSGQSNNAPIVGVSGAWGAWAPVTVVASRLPQEDWVLTTAWYCMSVNFTDNADHSNLQHMIHVQVGIGRAGSERIVAEFACAMAASLAVTTSTGMNLSVVEGGTAFLLPTLIPASQQFSMRASTSFASAPSFGLTFGGYFASNYPDVSSYPPQSSVSDWLRGGYSDFTRDAPQDALRRATAYPPEDATNFGSLSVTPATALSGGVWKQFVAPDTVYLPQLVTGIVLDPALSSVQQFNVYEFGLGPAGQEVPYSRLQNPKAANFTAPGPYLLPRPLYVPPGVGISIRSRSPAGTVAVPVSLLAHVIP